MKTNALVLLLGISCFSLVSEAQAKCTVLVFDNEIMFPLGAIKVLPTDPVGSVLKKISIPRPQNPLDYATCDAAGDLNRSFVLTHGYPLSVLGDKIYQTPIRGIGVRVSQMAGVGSATQYIFPYKLIDSRVPNPNTKIYPLSGDIIVEFIKTEANTASGRFSAGSYFGASYIGDYQLMPFYQLYNEEGTFVESSSCLVSLNKNQVINLLAVKKASFTGVGMTQGEKNFNINLLCNGEITTNTALSSKISIDFDYENVAGNTGLMKNLANDGTQATGVAIQMLSNYNSTTSIIKKGDRLPVGAVLANNRNVPFDIPMTVRYYQTAANVTPGVINAQATFTVNYQ